MNKLIKQLEKIQDRELEMIELIMDRDNKQYQLSELNDILKGVKEKILFKEDELRKEYAELKRLMLSEKK